MIYGNHNKRKGDIVKVARWDRDHMFRMNEKYSSADPGELKFAIMEIDYRQREIILAPTFKGPLSCLWHAVNLDETNLIRVSRMTEERV